MIFNKLVYSSAFVFYASNNLLFQRAIQPGSNFSARLIICSNLAFIFPDMVSIFQSKDPITPICYIFHNIFGIFEIADFTQYFYFDSSEDLLLKSILLHRVMHADLAHRTKRPDSCFLLAKVRKRLIPWFPYKLDQLFIWNHLRIFYYRVAISSCL